MRDCCRRLKPYIVPQDEGVVKLNQNESPFDVPEEIKERIFDRLRRVPWNRYPRFDPGPLRARLANYTDFPAAGILTGSSSNEIIQTVMLACCEPGDVVVIIEPGFSIYPRLGRILGLDVRSVPLGRDFRFEPDRLIAASRNARLTIFASPNNPTGTSLAVEEIDRLCCGGDGYLAIDEAYYEFDAETCQALIESHQRLMVIRTFSKAFGLAGVRLGYLLARPGIIEVMDKVKLPFSLGFFPQVCGAELLRDPRLIRQSAAAIVRDRRNVMKELKRLKRVRAIPSRANFILFQVRGMPAPRVFAGLRKQGVLIRAFDAPRLDQWLRVTIGRPGENEKFLLALKKILGAS